MKLFRYVVCVFLSVGFLISCSDDDEPDTGNNNDVIIGTWDLVSLNISPAQDIDMDGTASTNVLTELNCVEGTLTFSADNTWGLTFDGVSVTSITNDLFILRCFGNTTTSGTWQLQGSQLTLFRGFDAIFYTLSDNQLTNTIGEELPGFQSEVYQKR